MTMALDRGLVATDGGQVAGGEPGRPDPEVPERARRRSFTARYKLEILAAYDAAGPGEKGAILRREGLYSSHIVEWRRARDAQIARLRKEKARLEQELAKARFVVEVQAKLQALLETISESEGTGPGS